MPRERPPRARDAVAHHFTIEGNGGSITGTLHVGMYPDGRPCEVFITIAKAGSTLRGVTDVLAKTISHALQHGVPISELASSYMDTKFEPSGTTNDPDIPTAHSITDYIGCRLALDFPKETAP